MYYKLSSSFRCPKYEAYFSKIKYCSCHIEAKMYRHSRWPGSALLDIRLSQITLGELLFCCFCFGMTMPPVPPSGRMQRLSMCLCIIQQSFLSLYAALPGLILDHRQGFAPFVWFTSTFDVIIYRAWPYSCNEKYCTYSRATSEMQILIGYDL